MTKAPEQGPAQASRTRKKTGPPKGVRPAGRRKGSKNKRTIERERAGLLAQQHARLMEQAKVSGSAMDEAVASSHVLMKDLGMQMTRLAAGLAAFYQPHPNWLRDASGRLVNSNPNFDESKFRYYAELAMTGARDFAAYESPKLSAVVVGGAVSNEFTMTGGLPDELDGNLVINHGATEYAQSAPISETADQAADISSESGSGVPEARTVQGDSCRKAVG